MLLNTPNLTGKLELVWYGPYEVTKRLEETTYQLAVPERRNHKIVAHANRLKPWKDLSVNLFRVVVAQECVDSNHPVGRTVLGETEMSEDQRLTMQVMLSKHTHTVGAGKLGKALGCAHVINTSDSSPVRSHPYRIVPGWKEDLREEIMRLQDQNIIFTTYIPWSSSMVPVRKPTGEIRLCIDYRRLNAVTVDDPYEMPRITDLLDRVANARWLSKIDLNQGFYQIPMDEASKAKTAFCTPWGKFAFNRMPFGLKNAPATFQRYMDMALVKQNAFSSTYIDDVIIFSNTFEKHLDHIEEVLNALRAGLTAKQGKCVWGARTLEYLATKLGWEKLKYQKHE